MVEEPLIVVGSASYEGAVGFADVFECTVQHVLAGSLDQPSIQLTVLPQDVETLELLSTSAGRPLEITFMRDQENEPYDLAMISGFVDREQRSWRIESVRRV